MLGPWSYVCLPQLLIYLWKCCWDEPSFLDQYLFELEPRWNGNWKPLHKGTSTCVPISSNFCSAGNFNNLTNYLYFVTDTSPEVRGDRSFHTFVNQDRCSTIQPYRTEFLQSALLSYHPRPRFTKTHSISIQNHSPRITAFALCTQKLQVPKLPLCLK